MPHPLLDESKMVWPQPMGLDEKLAKLRRAVKSAHGIGVDGEWRRHYDQQLLDVLGVKHFWELQ